MISVDYMKSLKFQFLLWAPAGRPQETNSELLAGDIAASILRAGAEGLVLYCRDSGSRVRPPSPWLRREEPYCALVDVWAGDRKTAGKVESILKQAGYRTAAYQVEESVYTEYGGNRHSQSRSWPDGSRSPGVVSVNLLERPDGIARDEWIKRWHGIMSPVSEKLQPRTRYVRNLVLESLTPGSLGIEGIVVESWPSKRHVENPFLFYGSGNVFGMLVNMIRILRAVRSFLRVSRIRTVMMGEYFIKTGFGKSKK
jgi:hypothetical protein